jgi:hypothetical protein
MLPDGGSFLALLLVVGYLAEMGLLVLLAPRMLLTPFDEKERERIRDEARVYNVRALTLAGLTFAAISLIYGTAQSPSLVADALAVLVVSLTFFLVSYSLTALVHHRRLYWVGQDKSLAFGYLSMFAGVLVLVHGQFPTAFAAAVVGFGFVGLLHLMEFASDIRHWGQREWSLGALPSQRK